MPESEQAQQQLSGSPLAGWGALQPPPQGSGLGWGHPSQGTPPPLASPLSAGSAIFSPSLTLFLFPLLS